MGEGDCINKEGAGEDWRESDGKKSYTEDEGDGITSIPAIVKQ